MSENKLHIAMYPWFAMGHLTSFLHISNTLAERGHQIFFFIPTKTQSKLNSFNLNPHLISFIPISAPHIDGLPVGAKTMSDIPFSSQYLDLTSLPFIAALKPPIGMETIESGLPKGFEERVEGRGIVYGGWVQQKLILGHSSVGCFATHCGFGSLLEAMVNKFQLVLLPHIGDQIINARMMVEILKLELKLRKEMKMGCLPEEEFVKL